MKVDSKLKGIVLLSLATNCEVQGPDEWLFNVDDEDDDDYSISPYIKKYIRHNQIYLYVSRPVLLSKVFSVFSELNSFSDKSLTRWTQWELQVRGKFHSGGVDKFSAKESVAALLQTQRTFLTRKVNNTCFIRIIRSEL